MISWLTGEVISKDTDSCTLNVNGVGYLVALTSKHLDKLTISDHVEMHIEMHVRENEIRLFGFSSKSEKSWFNLLTSVQGVGPKVGLAILSTFSLQDLSSAIYHQDKKIISQANGVGPKMAMRLVTELKDKIPSDLHVLTPASHASTTGQPTASNMDHIPSQAVTEAESALVNLGYQKHDILRAMSALGIDQLENTDTGTLIRLTLKELAKG